MRGPYGGYVSCRAVLRVRGRGLAGGHSDETQPVWLGSAPRRRLLPQVLTLPGTPVSHPETVRRRRAAAVADCCPPAIKRTGGPTDRLSEIPSLRAVAFAAT
ncbi:unnamed protein product [Phaeothamnion confervicola]